MKVINTAGKIFYGMHFYPGVAQYDEPGKEPLRVFVNEDTIRKLDPTFAGKPIFVEHVDEVTTNVDELRKEADGWVVESFFNSADGKHWVKFIVVTKRAEQAIQNGFKLSNAYIPQLNPAGGIWNGVDYQQEVIGGEFEHLAIVKHPRYEESVIMTPDEFKSYNDELQVELKKIANSKDKETLQMSKLKFWNRKAAENSADLESLSVTLPKSGKEMTIVQLVNAMDEVEDKKKENMADPAMQVKLHDGSVCNVAELVEKHKALHEEHEALKAGSKVEEEHDLMPEDEPVEVEGDMHNADEDEPKDEPKEEPADKKKNAKKASAVDAARAKHFESLKNAREEALKNAAPKFDSIQTGVARGKDRYGSAKH